MTTYEILAYTVNGERTQAREVVTDIDAYRKKIMQQTGCKEVFLEYRCKK